MSRFIRPNLVFVLILLISGAGPWSPAVLGATNNDASTIELLRQAQDLLDQWQGERGILIEADKHISEALRREPKSAPALVERGRLLLMAGNTDNGLLPESLRAAEKSFLAAAAADPKYARAQILLGHVYLLMGEVLKANAALDRAESIGTDDPWLALNRAELSDRLNDPSGKVRFSEQAVTMAKGNRKVLLVAQANVYEHYTEVSLNRTKADEAFKARVALEPADAHLRGDHAQTVILKFGDFEAGARLAEEALAIMEYPHARGTLSLARYGLWARAIEAGENRDTIQRLFQQAQAVDPDTRYIPQCAMGYPTVQPLVRALKAKGLFDLPHHNC